MLALAAVLFAVASAGAPPPAAPAAAPEARALARKVQAFYERTHDLRARFEQTYSYAGAGRRQVSRGRLLVKKPGRMRWDYEEPEKKTIAVAESRLTQYEPEANQAYVDERFDASAMSAAVTFLLGRGNLEAEFDLSPGAAGTLVLRPKKPDPRVESVTLTVGPQGEVTATRVVDGSGNENAIVLERVERNVRLQDSDFEVRLPEGVHRLSAPGRSP